MGECGEEVGQVVLQLHQIHVVQQFREPAHTYQ